MRVLSLDPGMIRLGWGVLEGQHPEDPRWIGSGILYCSREKREEWQAWKVRGTKFYTERGMALIHSYHPDVIVNEIVPAVGGANFTAGLQNQLAQTVVTVFHTLAVTYEIPVYQLSANTVKKKIGGSGKASKVKVRNGVMALVAQLADRKQQWTDPKMMDEPDGIAVGLTWLGHKFTPDK